MFHHGGEDVVSGRTEYTDVPEGDIPHLPTPLIPHLTDNREGVVNAVDCHSGPT